MARRKRAGGSKRQDARRKWEAEIAALIAEPTLRAAAKKLGCSPRTLSRRLADPEFKAAYEEARAKAGREQIEAAIAEMVEAAAMAPRTLKEAMRQKKVPTARVKAADSAWSKALEILGLEPAKKLSLTGQLEVTHGVDELLDHIFADEDATRALCDLVERILEGKNEPDSAGPLSD